MYISELRVKNFKKFSNNKFLFNRGINIIKGQNEQGKSTILKAIIAALYTDPSSNKAKELFKSWNETVYPIIELDFFIDEKLYVCSKDFNTKEVVLKDVLAQTEDRNATLIQKRIQEYTGIINENVLHATVAIDSADITAIDSGKKSLHEALQSLSLETNGVNILELIKDISQKIDEMQVGLFHPAKNNGIIKRLQDEILERSEAVNKERATVENVDTSNDKLQSLTNELTDVTNQIQKYTQTVGAFEKKDTVVKELEELNEKIRIGSVDMSKLREIEERIHVVDEKFNALGGDAILDQLNENQKNLIDLNHQLQDLQTQLSHIRILPVETVKIAKKTNYFTLYIIFAVFALLFLVVGFLIGNTLVAILGMGIAFVTIVLIYILGKKEATDEESEIKPTDELGAMQTQIQEVKSRQNALLQACFMQSSDEFFSKRTQLIALKSDKGQMVATVEALLRGNNLREIQHALEENIQRKAELEVQLPQEEVMPREQYMRDKRELELLHLDKKDIENELAQLKAKLSVWDVDATKSKQDEERLQDLQNQLNDAKHRLDVLSAVQQALQQTKEDISVNISQSIQENVSQSLSNITNGRYTQLEMDNNFMVKVYSNEKQDWVNPHTELSRGTLDQIYISARLALAKLITGGKAFPIFFDDPFLTFDQKRRDMMLDELSHIAQNNQIFIFTCHDFFDVCGNVILLDTVEKT